MSLFIGLLAFPTSAELQDATKVGVLAGSFAAAAIGAALLSMSQPEPVPQREGEGARGHPRGQPHQSRCIQPREGDATLAKPKIGTTP